VARLLTRWHSGLTEVLDHALAPYGLTAAQYAVWSILAAGRAESAAEICKEISYDPGSMTRMLDRLEGKNFLRRIYSREDRRKLKLELTEQGLATYPEVQKCVGKVMGHVMGGISSEEMGLLADLMGRMVARLEEGAGPKSG
jgi:DNA-binding MarR family transcriptional regulator